MSKANIAIYRITHIENIPHILQNGITHKNSINSNPNYINIGDISLIDNRVNRVISIDNGDLEKASSKQITLGDYIPFYFGVRMPMLYTAQIGGNFVKEATPPEKIVYIACSVSKIIESGVDFYFSDGHATNDFTSFYDKGEISRINEILDYDSIKAKYWGGQENLNIKRKKQAEFLVSGDIKTNSIFGFVCYNESAKNKLLSFGVKQEIKVYPKAYF